MTDDPLTVTCYACGASVVLPDTTCHGDAVTCPECGGAGRVWAYIVPPAGHQSFEALDDADSERVAERLDRYVGER